MTDQEVLQIYIRLAPFLASLCGPSCEIAVHDLVDTEHSLVAIENNLSGREVGNPLTDFAKGLAKQGTHENADFIANYSGKTKHREFLSATYFIKNEGRLIGMLCVNKDTSVVKQLETVLAQLQTQFNLAPPSNNNYAEELDSPIASLMHSRITAEITQSGISPDRMSSEEKIGIVQRLHENGVTSMKGAVAEISDQLSISIPTVYRYMRKVSSN